MCLPRIAQRMAKVVLKHFVSDTVFWLPKIDNPGARTARRPCGKDRIPQPRQQPLRPAQTIEP
jgi:hypothetical protein